MSFSEIQPALADFPVITQVEPHPLGQLSMDAVIHDQYRIADTLERLWNGIDMYVTSQGPHYRVNAPLLDRMAKWAIACMAHSVNLPLREGLRLMQQGLKAVPSFLDKPSATLSPQIAIERAVNYSHIEEVLISFLMIYLVGDSEKVKADKKTLKQFLEKLVSRSEGEVPNEIEAMRNRTGEFIRRLFQTIFVDFDEKVSQDCRVAALQTEITLELLRRQYQDLEKRRGVTEMEDFKDQSQLEKNAREILLEFLEEGQVLTLQTVLASKMLKVIAETKIPRKKRDTAPEKHGKHGLRLASTQYGRIQLIE